MRRPDPRNGVLAKEPDDALNELIVALMRRGMSTEEEVKTKLFRLIRRDFLP